MSKNKTYYIVHDVQKQEGGNLIPYRVMGANRFPYINPFMSPSLLPNTISLPANAVFAEGMPLPSTFPLPPPIIPNMRPITPTPFTPITSPIIPSTVPSTVIPKSVPSALSSTVIPKLKSTAGVIIVEKNFRGNDTAIILFRSPESKYTSLNSIATSNLDNDLEAAAKRAVRQGSYNLLNIDHYDLTRQVEGKKLYMDINKPDVLFRCYFVPVVRNTLRLQQYMTNKRLMTSLTLPSQWNRTDNMEWFLLTDLLKMVQDNTNTCKNVNNEFRVIEENTVEIIKKVHEDKAKLFSSLVNRPVQYDHGPGHVYGLGIVAPNNSLINTPMIIIR